MKTIRIQDKYNDTKVWVINAMDSGTAFEWNQEINGEMFYPKFQPVDKEWIESTLDIKLDKNNHVYTKKFHGHYRCVVEFAYSDDPDYVYKADVVAKKKENAAKELMILEDKVVIIKRVFGRHTGEVYFDERVA